MFQWVSYEHGCFNGKSSNIRQLVHFLPKTLYRAISTLRLLLVGSIALAGKEILPFLSWSGRKILNYHISNGCINPNKRSYFRDLLLRLSLNRVRYSVFVHYV